MNEFFHDVWRGLNAPDKYLSSKYFYDETGDILFQEIMKCPEYYLTNCELDIFSSSSPCLSAAFLDKLKDFDVVELGAGDATKSIFLLKELLDQHIKFTYYPIDISENIIRHLKRVLPVSLPGIQVHGLNGDYFDMLKEVKYISSRNKVVLFLGSSIGNIPIEDTASFFRKLKKCLLPGDLVLTGFDLKKDASIVLPAYNDKNGITKRFNLNLLQRINDALDADFVLSNFDHRPEYSEETGACKSYLVSNTNQRIRIGEVGWIYFKEGERIYMEVSQKYTPVQTDDFARAAGFTPLRHFYDSRHWFLDALWQCNE